MFDVAHGAGLAAVWGSWARYVYQNCMPRFVRFAHNVMGVELGLSDDETALLGIERMEDFFRSIHMPTSVRELGVELTEAQILELAYKCSHMDKRTIGGIQKLTRSDMAEIYRMAK